MVYAILQQSELKTHLQNLKKIIKMCHLKIFGRWHLNSFIYTIFILECAHVILKKKGNILRNIEFNAVIALT